MKKILFKRTSSELYFVFLHYWFLSTRWGASSKHGTCRSADWLLQHVPSQEFSVCNSLTFQSTPSRLFVTPHAPIRSINETGRKRLSWPGNIKELSKLWGIRLVRKWDIFNHDPQKWTGTAILEWLARNVLSYWNSDWLTTGSELTAKLDLLARTELTSCALKDFSCLGED
jgi:hypothetical protein